MARRRPSSPGLLTWISSSHWSVGFSLGLAAFAAVYAGLPFLFAHAGVSDASLLAVFLARFSDTQRASALLGAALLPLLLAWVAAFTSWRAQSRRRALLDTQTGLASLRALRWQDFERLVAEAYRRQGYQVTETGGGGKDGGVDLLLRRRGKTLMVQCKQWASTRVSAPIVREMWGLVAHHGYAGVKIVSVGEFTADAAAFAQGKNMELVNGAALLALIRSVQSGSPHSRGAPPPVPAYASVSDRPDRSPRPKGCPQCGAKMVEREQRSTGEVFLGCSKYPQCNGTRPVTR